MVPIACKAAVTVEVAYEARKENTAFLVSDALPKGAGMTITSEQVCFKVHTKMYGTVPR